MIKNNEFRRSEAYRAPECEVLAMYGGQAVCETSFSDGEIDPGEGMDWGNL